MIPPAPACIKRSERFAQDEEINDSSMKKRSRKSFLEDVQQKQMNCQSEKMNSELLPEAHATRTTNASQSKSSTLQNFLAGRLKSEDVIEMSEPIQFIAMDLEEKRKRCKNHLELMNRKSSYVCRMPIAENEGASMNKSPLLISNFNATLESQTNVGKCPGFFAKLHRNIPVNEHAIFNPDEKSLMPEPSITKTLFQKVSKISCATQTDNVRFACGNITNRGSQTPIVILNDSGTQTTNNSGGFYCAIQDISILSNEQQKAVKEFERVMKEVNIEQESMLSGIIERLQYRRTRANTPGSNDGTFSPKTFQKLSMAPPPPSVRRR